MSAPMKSVRALFALIKTPISTRATTYFSKKLVHHHIQASSYIRSFSVTSVLKEDEVTSEEDKPGKQKRLVVEHETSIRYLKSKAYKTTYGEDPVWKNYRRNHKGGIPPEKTRRTCVRNAEISTGNPCPICRDEYLTLHYKNRELLKQFINPYTGEVLSYSVTGICQKQHKNLLIAVEQAQDYGLIDVPLPHRHYDYSEYYPTKESSST